MGNSVKTVLLLGALTGLLVAIGGALGGRGGMVLGLVLAGAMNFGSYWMSDRIVLRMYRAKLLEEPQAPELFAMVRRLCQRGNLPMPRLALVPQPAPNAFATGRSPDHAVVAVTDGLLRLLSPDELEGVLAHELAHVKNRDMLVGSVAATLAGAIMILASMARWAAIFGGGGSDDDGGPLALLATALLAPIGALLIQMAVSRSREYKADATGAGLAGSPAGLARALQKLEQASARVPMAAAPATAHLMIANPLRRGLLSKLFSTHPPMEERIRRLVGG